MQGLGVIWSSLQTLLMLEPGEGMNPHIAHSFSQEMYP